MKPGKDPPPETIKSTDGVRLGSGFTAPIFIVIVLKADTI
jgi:hypothetical protein